MNKLDRDKEAQLDLFSSLNAASAVQLTTKDVSSRLSAFKNTTNIIDLRLIRAKKQEEAFIRRIKKEVSEYNFSDESLRFK